MGAYIAIDAVNISTLKEIWRASPKHYRHALERPKVATPAMLLGTAVHMAVLEPDRFYSHYVIRPSDIDGRTKEGKAWLAANAGRDVLTHQMSETCADMRAAVAEHPVAARWLSSGQPEVILQWTDEDTGVACKGRADWISADGSLVGLKTGKDVTDERAFGRQAAALGYHLQWAYYYDGLCALGRKPPSVIEIAVDSDDVHDVCVWEIDDETLDAGRYAYRSALVTLAQCRERNEWPGRAPAVKLFRLPAYALPDDSDDLSDLDFGGAA